jgi:hypothetical protein
MSQHERGCDLTDEEKVSLALFHVLALSQLRGGLGNTGHADRMLIARPTVENAEEVLRFGGCLTGDFERMWRRFRDDENLRIPSNDVLK